MKINDLIKTKYIHFIGRTYNLNNALHINFSGSGVRVVIDSNYLKLRFKARFKDANNIPYIALIIDGKISYIAIDEAIKDVNITLDQGIHTIDILKNTESSISQLALLEIDACKFITYNHPQKLKLEFYGDSITCGYGVLDECETNSFKSQTESFVDGYAYLASQNLNADYSVISVSGFPIYKSRWNEGFPIDSVADMISICDYEEPMTFNDTHQWDNKKYIPDVVVINLGTNDESYFTEGTSWIDKLVQQLGSYEEVKKSEKFQEELNKMEEKIVNFLDTIFSLYGEIKVVYATGILPIIDVVNQRINQVINEYQKNTMHKVYRYEFKVREHFNKRGANYHPGKMMHKFAGVELANFIFDILDR